MIIENLQPGDTVLVNKGDRGQGTELVTLKRSHPSRFFCKVLYQADNFEWYANDGKNDQHSIRRKVMLK